MSLLNQYLKKIGEEEPKTILATPLPSMLRGQQKSYGGWGNYKIILIVFIPTVLIGLVVWQTIIRKPHYNVHSGAAQARGDEEVKGTQQKTTSNLEGIGQIKPSAGHQEVKTTTVEHSIPPVTVENLISPDPTNVGGKSKKIEIMPSGVGTGQDSKETMMQIPLQPESVSGNALPVAEEKTEFRRMVIEKHTEIPKTETTQPDRYRIPNSQVATTLEQKTSPLPSKERAQNYYQLGLGALQRGNLAEAAKYFNDMLNITPNDIDGLLNLSNVYIRQDRLDSAVEALGKIRKLDAKNYKSLDNLGFIAIRQGNTEDARKYFIKALSLHPSDEIALGNLAYLAQTDNRPAEAAKYYDKLISINPLNVDALMNYAHLMSQEKDFSRAIQLYTQCLGTKSVKENRDLAKKISQRIKLMSVYK